MPGREDVFEKAMNDGHSAAWDGLWDRAVVSYHAALDEYPDHPKALNSLALALYQLQHFEEALTYYQRAAKISPTDPVPFEKIAHICERLGNIKDGEKAAMFAAETYLMNHDVDKAIENWTRVTQLNPENVNARWRLALVHEKLGHARQAATEYQALASLMQHSGNVQKAEEFISLALQLAPDSTELRQAQAMLRTGQLLPRPVRPKGGTGPLRMAQVKQLEAPQARTLSGVDPITEGRKKALQMLADTLFDLSDESAEAQTRRGLQAIVRGTGQLISQQSEQSRILLHLSQAIDSQTKGQEAQAAEELERALEAGFRHAALYFDLGYIRSHGERLESALRHLQHCVRHVDYGLPARLLNGQILRRMGRNKEATLEFLEALKLADAMVVEPDQADAIRQLYEPIIESQTREADEHIIIRLCDNINAMLMRDDWREHLLKSREQLPRSGDSGHVLPLAEILIQAQSSHVIEAISTINQLARAGHLRSALDEAYTALQSAPTYLPLHTLIGDLLIRDGRPQDAITKFTVVANAYSVRGEAAQATNLFRRILQLAPMDLAVRTRLIEQLTARGQLDEAISEYLELADIYYRLAELDMARKTYTTALRLAQQPSADRSWSLRILHRMADIDMQRLDWKQALRVYEQIRTIKPDDEIIRRNLIDLHTRMGLPAQALAEAENYITFLDGNHRAADAVKFLEALAVEQPESLGYRRLLADQYRRAGRVQDAIDLLDVIGNVLMDAGNREGVVEVINQIISLNPPNIEEYRQLLVRLKGP